MGEPERQLEDIEPDIRPNLRPTADNNRPTQSASRLNDLESNPDKPISGSINDQESVGSNNTQSPWKNSVAGSSSSSSKKSRRALSFIKKKGPLTTIIIAVLGGGVGLSVLFSPGLLLVQFKEVLVDKFDTQLTSMNVRTTKILSSKISGSTSGICGSSLTILCKYSTMSQSQVDKFAEAGITVNYDKTTLTGRVKPTEFEFDGKTIKASEFKAAYDSDDAFRAAVKDAYSPKYAGFADAVWDKVSSIFKISKESPTVDGSDFDDELSNIDNQITEDNQLSEASHMTDQDIDPETGEKFADEIDGDSALAKANESIDALNEVAQEAGGDESSLAATALNDAKEGINAVKVTGFVDSACTVYRTMKATSYAAKALRVIQLADYAMMFLNVADQIKAGVAKPEDTNFFGTVLTKPSTDDSGNSKTATDSFGYKYAAYNEADSSKMQTSTMQYLAAAGMTGAFANFLEHFKFSDKTCTFLGNPAVGFTSFAVGLGLTFFTGGSSTISTSVLKETLVTAAKTALKTPAFWAGTGLALSEVFLPGLLKNIIAGKVINKTTVGANAGDAITSGASGIMSSLAKNGGNAPLTPNQAVAYNSLTEQVANEYAKEDRSTYGQFNISNSNTFLGKLASMVAPYFTKLSSLSGALSVLPSLASSTFSVLAPSSTRATSASDYSQCSDTGYRDMNLATDPFCNVIYGIPTEDLDISPTTVYNNIKNELDENNSPIAGSNYEKFMSNCINRNNPLGYQTDSENDGKQCMYSSSNKYYYLYTIDQRVLNGMEQTTETNASTDTSDPGDSSQPANTTDKGSGWTLKDNTDYSATKCASGTTDKGTYKHPVRGFTIRLCETHAVGQVASIISQRTMNMIAAAKQDGITLTGSGYRSYETQNDIYSKCAPNCGNKVAKPGNSNHEKGLAIDFHHGSRALTTSDPEHKWLDENGKKYGFINYPVEAWHYSMSGG